MPRPAPYPQEQKETAGAPPAPRGLAGDLTRATHLLPFKDTTPSQQLVAEPVLAYRQAPEGEPR